MYIQQNFNLMLGGGGVLLLRNSQLLEVIIHTSLRNSHAPILPLSGR